MRDVCAECRRVLVVEDEGTLRVPLHDYLESKGARVTSVVTGTEGVALALRQDFDLVFTDIRLPGVDGFEVLRRVLETSPGATVVMMTAYADVASAIKAVRLGAYDYLPKPFSFDQIDAILLRHCRERKIQRERDELKAEVEGAFDPAKIVACSRAMQSALDTVRRVAPSDTSVVLLGETGTGKELLAEALHYLSPRRSARLVKLNCSAVPETLIESEMFGHERGAFTGAVARKRGRFEMADGGTLFLDEIGDFSPAGQVKLLRAIQEGTFERVGGTETIRVDVRLIAATHRDLKDLVHRGVFREDLFYRLAVMTVEVPPLRERGADLEPLVRQLLERAARRVRRPVPEIDAGLLDALRRYPFPGNVRELQNLLERAVTLCDSGVLDVRHFPPEVGAATRVPPADAPDAPILPLAEASARFEAEYIAAALRRTGARRTEAAALLGISRKTLWQRLKEPEGSEGGES